MQSSDSFKRLFLKKFLLGLQQCDLSSKRMSLLERKNSIKLSSDIALASASIGANWSRALIADISKQEKNKSLLQKILGDEFHHLVKPCHKSFTSKTIKSKMIMKRCRAAHRIRKRAPRRIVASVLARRMLNRRKLMLKSLIPGGESMDEFSLLNEAIDYVRSLRAQIDVMERLENAFELLDGK